MILNREDVFVMKTGPVETSEKSRPFGADRKALCSAAVLDGFIHFDYAAICRYCREKCMSISPDQLWFIKDCFVAADRDPTEAELAFLALYRAERFGPDMFSDVESGIFIEEGPYKEAVESPILWFNKVRAMCWMDEEKGRTLRGLAGLYSEGYLPGHFSKTVTPLRLNGGTELHVVLSEKEGRFHARVTGGREGPAQMGDSVFIGAEELLWDKKLLALTDLALPLGQTHPAVVAAMLGAEEVCLDVDEADGPFAIFLVPSAEEKKFARLPVDLRKIGTVVPTEYLTLTANGRTVGKLTHQMRDSEGPSAHFVAHLDVPEPRPATEEQCRCQTIRRKILLCEGRCPNLMRSSPFHGGASVMVRALGAAVAAGASWKNVRLYSAVCADPSDPDRITTALLGLLDSQIRSGIPIEPKAFLTRPEPGDLITVYAVAVLNDPVSSRLKAAGDCVVCLPVPLTKAGLPDYEILLSRYERIHAWTASGQVLAAAVTDGDTEKTLCAMEKESGFVVRRACVPSCPAGSILLEVVSPPDDDEELLVGTVVNK